MNHAEGSEKKLRVKGREIDIWNTLKFGQLWLALKVSFSVAKSLNLIFGLLATIFVVSNLIVPPEAKAASASDFEPGFIISDEKFFDANSMSAAEIQSFIVSKVSNCASGYTCLKDFRQATASISSDRFCNGYTGAAAETAGDIIYKVAQSCGISPKSLIVLIEKESSLITHTGPGSWRYTSATGMGCPDTAPCDPAFNGFFYQVYYGARSFQRYVQDNGSYNYGWNQTETILFNPNGGCGTQDIFIKNSATAALYNYTPYAPNAAALNNLYGTGDSCSAYGNRNFWRIYSDWFGNPKETGSPVGNIDFVRATPGGVRLAGWVFDPDTAASIPLHVYVNGIGLATTASNTRTDVGAIWPAVGSAHGFDLTIPVQSSGTQNVCIYGINIAGGGSNKLLGCRTLAAYGGAPMGALDSVALSGTTIKVNGWAFDPDTLSASQVHVYVGNNGFSVAADQARSDINSVYPVYTGGHGFSGAFPSPGGTFPVCAYAIDVKAPGANKLLGCKTINSLSGSPVGAVDAVVPRPGYFQVSGWAFDPDTTESSPVHVYADTNGVSTTANGDRADVGAAYPGYGNLHAYSVAVPANPGVNNVCVYGINIAGKGENKVISCRQVMALSGSPVGVLDTTSGVPGGINIAGWAYDPDTASSIPIHVYIDGRGYQFTADHSRPDFGLAYPLYGANHGYKELIPAAPGIHNVCVYGLNVAGAGDNKNLKCVVVESY